MDEKSSEDVEMKESPAESPIIQDKPKEVEEINDKSEVENIEVVATLTAPPVANNAAAKKKIPNKQKKKRKKKTPKDVDAPKIPLTGTLNANIKTIKERINSGVYRFLGYVRFTNEKRDDVRKKHPGVSAIDVTKILAEDWNKLPDDEKKPYLKAAEIDRERYHKEIGEYKQQNELKKAAAAAVAASNGALNESSNESLKNNKENKSVMNEKSTPSLSINGNKDTANGNTAKDFKLMGEIPIFTDEFLEHNKNIDSELRILRKSNTDYEQQNAVLEKHVENMSNGIEKLETETNSLKENNSALDKYLDVLKIKLSSALAGLSLPGHPNGATADNIDEYMAELQEMTTSNSHPPATINKAKDIIRKLDLSIQI